MDVCRKVSVSGECQQERRPLSLSPSLDDLFSSQNMEVDVGLEWLSVFVEDCFSSPPSCLLSPPNDQLLQTTKTPNSKPSIQQQIMQKQKQKQNQNQSPLHNFVVPPGKARSKRKRLSAPRTTKDPLLLPLSSMWSSHSHHLNNPQINEPLISDPSLLKQAYWLADSELIIVPKREEDKKQEEEEEEEEEKEKKGEMMLRRKKENLESSVSIRRCSHCLAQRTPQWRAGPLGPKTLCNACGVRYKSGRLLPEYRPAKSPTFVSFLHSNSHKKVMEMRMAIVSSIPSEH
ncbi:GATA transcription factor 9 [Senna tora]|uniref:GATA transcription factor 9 n=1 Tax=Senna tora TaxID=362788 RepID=A0A834SDP5_9FABA|nr:GATA transcription factor 9 [Senna tora]